MNCYQRVEIWLGLIFLLICQVANAATYNISQGQLPTCNNWNNSWSVNGTTYTCSSSVNLLAGDKYVANGPVTLRAEAGITLSSNEIGSAENPVSLQTSYGTLDASNGSSIIYGNLRTESGALILAGVSLIGNIQASGTITIERSTIEGNVSGAVINLKDGSVSGSISGSNITLNGTDVGGGVTGSGSGNFTNLTIGGSVSMANGLTATNTVFTSTLTSTNGAISLSGGSVAGLVKTNCCTITTKDTDLSGGAQARSGITIEGGVIAGELKIVDGNGGLVNNNIVIKDAVMVSGDINAFNVQISNSQVGSSQSSVKIIARGNYLNLTNNTTAYGHVEVSNTYGKINIESGSKVIGTCLADTERNPNVNNNVNGECGGDEIAAIHHYQLSYSSPALSCQAIPVTVIACADAACSATVAQSNNVTLTPSGRWIGGATKTFADSGSMVAYLTREAGSVTLGLSGDSYACTPGNCIIEIRDSGFQIEVPDMIANKPVTATVQAVRKGNNSEKCVADGGFAGKTKAVSYWSSYLSPDADSQVGNRSIILGDSAIGRSEVAATIRNTTFNANAQAQFILNYTDAGQMQLNASYTGTGDEAGLLMSGSGSFVSRPYGLYLATDSTCSVAGVSDDCPRFTKAGDAFSLRIEAKAWEREGEPRTAQELKDNIVTPNFQMAGIVLKSELVAPSNGQTGTVTPASYDHALGERSTAQVTLSEVGVFRLTATPATPTYFGLSVDGGQSALVGRITPAWLELDVDDSDLTQEAGCPAPSAFTYQDQPTRLSGGLKVKGFGRDHNQTLNYRDDFWRVGIDQVYGLYRSDSAPTSDEGSHVTPKPSIKLDPATARLQFNDDYRYPRQAMPSATDAPLELKWMIWDLHDDDGVYFSNRQGAQSTWGSETEGVLISALIQDSQFRLGQVRSENIRVPLGNSAQAPIILEHWNGTTWQAATDNNCTTLDVPTDTPEQLSFPDPGVTAATLDAANWNQSLLQVIATEPAPSAPQGSVLLRHLLRSDGASATWLCRRRSEASAPLGGVCSYREEGNAETRSSITFGIYQGPEPLIFRREVYR